MANAVSQLIIKLVEQVSGPAAKASASLAQVEKSAAGLAKTTAGTDKIAKSVKDIGEAAKGLNVNWSDRFNAEVGKMGLAADKLTTIKREWKDLIATINRKDIVSSMPRLDKWETDTLASLRKVEREAAKARASGKASAAGDGGGAYPGILALGRRMLGPLALGYSGYHLGKDALKAGAGYEREQYRGSLSGMTPGEISESAALAGGLSRKYLSVGQQEIMEHVRKLRGTLGDFHHATDMVESVVKAQAVLSSGPSGKEGAIRDLDQITKGLEGAGFASDPKKFERMLDAFVKGKNLFGETLSGEDFRTYVRNSNSSKYGLSEDYLAGVVPTMIQHEGAAKFATSQMSAFNALIGDHMTKPARAQLRKMGLFTDKNELIDRKLFVSDPDQWVAKNLKERLEKAGGKLGPDASDDDRAHAVNLLTKMFSNRQVAEFFAAILSNLPVIEKDRANLKTAKGNAAAGDVTKNDSYQAWEAVKSQSENLAQNMLASGGVIAKALSGLATLIGGIAWLESAEGKKATNPTDTQYFDGISITPLEDQADIQRRTKAAEEAERRRLDGTPNTFNFSDMSRPAEAGAAGTESGSGFRQGLKEELNQAEKDVATSVQRMLNMLNFNASPSVTPNISAPAPGKQSSISNTSRQLARRIEDRSIGNFTDTEYG